MQTLNLIIPMAGIGKRFTDKNYKTYKTLLKVDNFNTVYDKIISNFKHKRLRIILIINRETSKKYKIQLGVYINRKTRYKSNIY